MRFQEVIITPQMATDMLSHNMRNRRLNEKRVRAYAKDIVRGQWTITPTPISFAEDGTLIDGQHRLSAIVTANTPVTMLVAYDVPVNSVIDRGLPRDSGASLYIRGLIDKAVSSRNYMAMVNQYLAIRDGGTIQDGERAEFINQNQDKMIAAMEISKTGAHNPLCKRAPVQVGLMAALMQGVSEETLSEFANIVNSGFATSATQSSAIVLRNYLLEEHRGGQAERSATAACTQMAIRDYVNQNPRQLKYRRKYHVYINNKEACAQQA